MAANTINSLASRFDKVMSLPESIGKGGKVYLLYLIEFRFLDECKFLIFFIMCFLNYKR